MTKIPIFSMKSYELDTFNPFHYHIVICLMYMYCYLHRYPGLRRIVGRLVKSVLPDPIKSVGSIMIPCDSFNRDNSCPYPSDAIGHLDARHVQRIHSCTICYLTLGGMINIHRQTECPLLSLIDCAALDMSFSANVN